MTTQQNRPGLIRRLGALVYDWLLIVAIWFVETALLLPFTHGEAIPQSGVGHWAYQALLAATAVFFFVFFWRKNGQTLGMRAWRLRLVDYNGSIPTTRRLLLRALSAIPSWGLFGFGVLAMYLDPMRRSLHDRLSGTQLIRET